MIISNEIMDYIAKSVQSNIRELEGALTKVYAYRKLLKPKEDMTLETAQVALADYFSDSAKPSITPNFIIDIISNHYGITPDEIRSQKRSRTIARPRQIAMYFCRKLTDYSFEYIGNCFGGKDHSTVMHGCDKVTLELENNLELQQTFFELEKKIKG